MTSIRDAELLEPKLLRTLGPLLGMLGYLAVPHRQTKAEHMRVITILPRSSG